MKRYIKGSSESTSQNVLNIFELFDSCEMIYLNDIEDYTHQTIYGISIFSNSAIPDDVLINLPKKKKDKISDLDTLLRLDGLKYKDFNMAQMATLGMYYRDHHFITPKEAVKAFLPKLTECNNIYSPNFVDSDSDTKEFIDKYGVTASDIMSIVKSLNIHDYSHTLKSAVTTYFGNELYVFTPNREFRLENGTELGNIIIYVKIDSIVTSARRGMVFVVSFHDTKSDSGHPY